MDDAKARLLTALPFLRHAMEEALAEAGEGGNAGLGIIATKADGSGKVIARFEAPAFFEDLAEVLGASELSDEDRAVARMRQFLDEHGLSNRRP